jgi:hypothetical protein
MLTTLRRGGGITSMTHLLAASSSGGSTAIGVIGIILIFGFIGVCIYMRVAHPERFPARTVPNRLYYSAYQRPTPMRSEVGLKCSRCGGTQFTYRRKRSTEAFVWASSGLGAAVARKSLMVCKACGAKYRMPGRV